MGNNLRSSSLHVAMKIIFALVFLITGTGLQAQNKPVPTQFDRFIQRPGIEWAAYASDTFNFTNAGFNLLLLNRLNKKQVKASLPVESRSSEAGNIRYTGIDSIEHAFYGDDNTFVLVDSTGEPIEKVRSVPQYDNSNFTTTEITQVLYIEKGKLKSYIPFVTPMLPVHLLSGQYIGQRFFFTSCFNYAHTCKARKKTKLVLLSHTSRLIKLDAPADQLKTLYGRNLVETLWPAIIKNKTAVFDATDNRRLQTEELSSLHSKEPVMIPVYDSIGNISRYEVFEGQATEPGYTAVALQQDWYYDSRKNKVFSFITGLLLYTSKSGTAPYLKVVFE